MVDRQEIEDRYVLEPKTGIFYNRRRLGSRAAGHMSGSISSNGYRYLLFSGGQKLLAHRLVWFLTHDVWPKEIDHINGNPDDNRIENLRTATHAENCRNSRRHKDNKSGVKGVCWEQKRGRWAAYICVDGRRHGLGRFRTKEDAASAYREAALEFHGKFAPSGKRSAELNSASP